MSTAVTLVAIGIAAGCVAAVAWMRRRRNEGESGTSLWRPEPREKGVKLEQESELCGQHESEMNTYLKAHLWDAFLSSQRDGRIAEDHNELRGSGSEGLSTEH